MTERMTAAEYNAKVALQMKEKVLQERIRKYARELRQTTDPTLLYYHTHSSTHSPAGFPDVYLISERHGMAFVAELKAERKSAKPSQEQRNWLTAFESSGIPAYLWRPRHWLSGEIQDLMFILAIGGNLDLAVEQDSRWKKGRNAA